MSGIRVTYSGLISLVVGLVSVITGLIFILVITRRLTPDEFGTWSLIGGLIIYVVVVEPVISFWTTRQTARGLNVGRTAIFSSAFFSAGGMLAYIVIAYFVGQQSDADLQALLFATILIPFYFLTRTFTAIALGWKPQSVSYGLLAFESTKIPAGIIFVYLLDLGVEGAILSVVVAYVGNIIVLGIYVKDKIKDKFQIVVLKKWIRLSWIPLYKTSASLIFSLDVMIFSIMTGSVLGVAYYAIALTTTSLIGHSGLIAKGLYPKLLEGGKREHLQENLTKFFYFAFPLVALSLSFAKPALFTFNPLYVIAVPVVIFMAIRGFLYTTNGIFSEALLGIEQVDINEESRFSDFVKSRLFSIPTIFLIQFSLYVASLAMILLVYQNNSQLELAILWSIVLLGSQIPFSVYFYLLVRKHFTLAIGAGRLLKYMLTSIVIFSITYMMMEEFLVYNESIFEFLPPVLLFAGVAIGGYLSITYIIDSKTRELFKSILKEIRRKSG